MKVEKVLKSDKYKTINRVSSNASLFGLATAMLVPTLGASITNVALPTFATSFNASLTDVNWILIAYFISITSLVISAGVLGDRFGKKRLLLIGISVFLVCSMMCALATELWVLIVARLFQGIGAAIIIALTLAIASMTLPKQNTGTVMGLLGAMSATGTALGPIIGGFIINMFGWPFIFWLMIPLAATSFIICSIFIQDDKPNILTSKKIDLLGTFFLGSSCTFYALCTSDDASFLSESSGTWLLLSISFFVFFIQSQRQMNNPLVDLSLFKHKLRNMALFTNFIVDAVAMATLVIGAFYLTYALKLSALNVGLVMSSGPTIAALTGYLSGKLVDVFGDKPIMFLGLAQMCLGAILFALLPLYFGWYGYIAAIVILTPGRQMFLASNHTYILHTANDSQKGLLSGMLNLSKNLGLLTGASLAVGFFAFRVQLKDISQASYYQLDTAFSETFLTAALFIFLCLVGIAYFHRQEFNK
jgi:MFS family permease